MITIDRRSYFLALLLRKFTGLWRLPQRPREKIARGMFHPGRQQQFPFRIALDGIAFRGAFSEYLDWRIFFLGSFERETINLCRYLAPHAEFPTFCDIGANKGLYSLLLARSYRRVVAFEPLGGNVSKLRAALAENRIENVEVLALALGETDGEAPFFLPPMGNEGIGSFVPDHVPDGHGTQVIAIRQGDALFRQKEIRAGLIKIDTEGFEWQVLQGLKETLRRDRPFVVIEIGDSSKAAIREGGGLHMALPPDYLFYEISDHTTVPQFSLKEVAQDRILARPITNNLACPREKSTALSPFVWQ